MAVEIVDANGNAVTGQATVNRTSISFTTGNGTTEQTITVTAVNDSVAEATANYTIRLKPLVSTDTNYSGVDPVDIPVTILDND
jgi:Tfp pilus assembly major pilin PilA